MHSSSLVWSRSMSWAAWGRCLSQETQAKGNSGEANRESTGWAIESEMKRMDGWMSG